jgi:hypothetical protein
VPGTLNSYGYAQGNPITNLDPTGLLCVGIGLGAAGVLGKIPLFDRSRAGAAIVWGFAVVVCGGGAAPLNVGSVQTSGRLEMGPPEANGGVASGAYVGGGVTGLFSSNATQVSDFKGRFRSESFQMGLVDLQGSVDFSSGVNDLGESIDVITVTPPGPSLGAGAAYTLMPTNSITTAWWSYVPKPY